ncbi:MAG: OmpA family protein [Planctomycetota bacterium]
MVAKKAEDPPPAGAPLYMVSFGDMITIMLTFFILLCSYATQRQAGFVADGVGAFQVVLDTLGLPGVLPGVRQPVDLGATKVRYMPAGAINYELLETEDGQLDDLNRNALRDVVKKALTSDEVVQLPTVFVFDYRQTTLSADHRAALDAVATLLRRGRVRLRIEGFAYQEELPPRETRALAAARARAVGDYLTDQYGIARSRIDTVGAGSGGAGKENRANRQVQDFLGRRIAIIYLVPEER